MSVYKKLFEAKKEIGKISKDSTNPFYKSKYFDINQLLEHVEPILQKNKLLLLQPIENDTVVTRIHDIEGDVTVQSSMSLTSITDPQKRGSEITYYRRYTLASLLGMQAEDDDANKTVKSNDPSPTKWLNATESDKKTPTKEWNNIMKGINEGMINSVNDVRKYYKVSKEVSSLLELALS